MEGLGKLFYARWLVVIVNTRLLGTFSCPNTCKKTWSPLITSRVLCELKKLNHLVNYFDGYQNHRGSSRSDCIESGYRFI